MNEKFCFSVILVTVILYLITLMWAGKELDISFMLQSAAWCFGIPIVILLLSYIYMGFDAAYQQRETLRQERK